MVDERNNGLHLTKMMAETFQTGAGIEIVSGIQHTTWIQQMVKTLDRLYRANKTASENNLNTWEFAIEISDLLECGISRQTLREMVLLGWVCHQREITLPNLQQREFQNEAAFAFSERSCFMITAEGENQFCDFLKSCEMNRLDSASSGHPAAETKRPTWDGNLRELRLGNTVVKRFKWPAAIQFAVLERFEDLGWPSRITNPLPDKPNICPKRRLHDAIKCLNQRKENELIRFRGDGTGQGVLVQVATFREHAEDE